VAFPKVTYGINSFAKDRGVKVSRDDIIRLVKIFALMSN